MSGDSARRGNQSLQWTLEICGTHGHRGTTGISSGIWDHQTLMIRDTISRTPRKQLVIHFRLRLPDKFQLLHWTQCRHHHNFHQDTGAGYFRAMDPAVSQDLGVRGGGGPPGVAGLDKHIKNSREGGEQIQQRFRLNMATGKDPRV